MKRFSIGDFRFSILVLCVFCALVRGANEICAFNAGATTCFAVVREIDGDVWYVTGQVFEVWGTAARTAADYDIALTNKSGGMFVGSMDTNIAAGQYYVVTHQQAGAGPTDTDPAIWQEYGDWTGSVWTPATITPADVWTHNISAYSGAGQAGTYLDTLYDDWINGGRLDLLIDAIKAVTDIMEAVNSTVSVKDDANSFTIANTGDINDVNDAYNGMTVYVKDATTGDWEARLIENWETGRVITVDTDFTFTPDVGDRVVIWGVSYFPPSIYNGLPLPPKPEVIVIDYSTSAGGGTTTLDEAGDDP